MDEIIAALLLLQNLKLEETQENIKKLFASVNYNLSDEVISFFFKKLNGKKISELINLESTQLLEKKPVEEKPIEEEKPVEEEKETLSDGLQALFG